MKKINFLFLILLFTTCGQNNDGKQKIQYWSFFVGGDGGYMQDLVDKFNRESEDISVMMTVIDWGSYYTKLSTAYLSGDLPDIATSHAHRLATLPSYGNIYSVEEIGKFDWFQFPKTTADNVLLNGKNFGIPLDTHGWVMYYNPDYVKETSLVDLEGEWIANSWDLLMKGLAEVQEKFPNIQPLGINNPDVALIWTWYSLYRQLGGKKYLSEDGFLEVDLPIAKQALDAIKSAIDKKFMGVGSQVTSDLMQEGKVAVVFEGVWTAGAIRPKRPQVVAQAIPAMFGNAAGAWGDNHILFFPKASNNPPSDKQQAALKFAQWLIDHGAYWANAGHVPSKISVQNSQEYLDNPNSVFKDIAITMCPWPKNENINLALDGGVLENALQSYIEGTVTDVDQIFRKANEEIKNKKG
ncbi:MAG: extracellular solute-binding protein [Brevinema sp.]